MPIFTLHALVICVCDAAMDISSDLTALGRTPIAVISAGVKSILDIPKTLEYLETQEVYVAAYKSDEFPAFFTEKSGCKVQNCSLSLNSIRCFCIDI
jgi:pseudouridine-5'-phosphate glycosidase